MTTRDVLAEVFVERVRQEEKWGEQNHPDESRIVGHSGDLLDPVEARRRCDIANSMGVLSWEDVLIEEVAEAIEEVHTGSVEELREELIQVAAVAVAWVEGIDRR